MYTRETISPSLREKLAQIFDTLILILALTRKTIKRGRAWEFGRHLLLGGDNDDIKSAVARLDKLTQSESRLVGAETLIETKRVHRTLSNMGTIVAASNTALQDHGTILENLNVKMDDMRQELSHFSHSGAENVFMTANMLQAKLKEILKPSVSAIDLYDRISRTRLAATGDWIREERLFSSWFRNEFPLLWISGNPGAGKTYLAANIISYINDKRLFSGRSTSNVSVSYFFFKDNSPETRSVQQALRDLSYQLSLSDPLYARYLISSCQSQDEIKTIESAWRLLYVEYFLRTSDCSSVVYLVLDGIDEAYDLDRKALFELLTELDTRQGRKQAQVQVVLLGRPHVLDELLDALEHDHLPTIHVTEAKTSSDIDNYIDTSIRKSKTLKLLPFDLKDQIAKTLSTKAQGMFLWVDLMLQELYKKKRPSAIQEALQRAPKGLNEMLRHVLENFSATLQDEDPDDLNELLAWVTCTESPLTLGQLDTILRLRSTSGDSVISLESSLRTQYAAFFTLTREDKLTTADLQGLRSESVTGDSDSDGECHDDVMFESYSQSNPFTTVVTFCHASIGDFFRNELEGQVSSDSQCPPIGVSINDARFRTLRTCLSLFGGEATRNKDMNDTSMDSYARAQWLNCLATVRISKCTIFEKQIIGRHLIRMFTNESTVLGWISDTKQQFRKSKLAPVINWLQDPEVIDSLSLDDRAWVKSIAEDFASMLTTVGRYLSARWLQTTLDFPESMFLNLYSLIKRMNAPGNASDALIDLANQPTASEIFQMAEWAGFQRDALWYRRIAVILRRYAFYDSALEHFEISLSTETLKNEPALWQTRAGMAGLYFLKKDWDKVIELDSTNQMEMLERPKSPLPIETPSGRRWLHNVHERMAKSYIQLDDRTNALKHFQMGLEVRKTCQECLFLSVLALMRAEQHKDVMDLLKGLRDKKLRKDESVLDALIETDGSERFLDLCSYAARATRHTQLLVDIYNDVLDTARRKARTATILRLELRLAGVYQQDSREISKAIRIWNRLTRLTQVEAGQESFMGRVWLVATNNLASTFLRRALSATQDSDELSTTVQAMERLAQPLRNAVGNIVDVIGTPQAVISLGQWYRLSGRPNDAHACFKAYMKQFLTPKNYEWYEDDDGYEVLPFNLQHMAILPFVLLIAGHDAHATLLYRYLLSIKALDVALEYDESGDDDISSPQYSCPQEDDYESHRIGDEGEDWSPGYPKPFYKSVSPQSGFQ